VLQPLYKKTRAVVPIVADENGAACGDWLVLLLVVHNNVEYVA
jgi:hypothetical protein